MLIESVQGLVFPMMGRVGVEKVGGELADHVTISVEVNFPILLSKELVGSLIVLCLTEYSFMFYVYSIFPLNFFYDGDYIVPIDLR